MKRLSILLLLVCFIAPVFAASLSDINDERIAYQYSLLYAKAEAHRIGMKAVLDYLGEAAPADLQESYDSFVGYYDDMEAAVDAVDFEALRAIRTAMIAEANTFRTKARNALGDEIAGARLAIKDALTAHEAELAANEESAYDKHAAFVLGLFDTSVNISEQEMRRIKQQGVDISELETELSAIKAKKQVLEEKMQNAHKACIGNFFACNTSEYKDYVNYRREIDEDFQRHKWRVLRHAFMNWIDNAKRKTDELHKRLSSITAVNTTDYLSSLDDIYLLLDQAENRLEETDYEDAKQLMQYAREHYHELYKIMLQLRQQTRQTNFDVRADNIKYLDIQADNINRAIKRVEAYEASGLNTSAQRALISEANAAYEEAKSVCASNQTLACNQAMLKVNEKLHAIVASSKAMKVPDDLAPQQSQYGSKSISAAKTVFNRTIIGVGA